MTDTHVVLPEEVDNNDESIEHIRSLDTSMLYNYGEFHRKRSPEAKKLFQLFLNFSHDLPTSGWRGISSGLA